MKREEEEEGKLERDLGSRMWHSQGLLDSFMCDVKWGEITSILVSWSLPCRMLLHFSVVSRQWKSPQELWAQLRQGCPGFLCAACFVPCSYGRRCIEQCMHYTAGSLVPWCQCWCQAGG